ncbi:hypothetical protein [Neisseria meningitidis]|uniref:hypothetical protein n=1 Tax=Neisseria meningitidis TaxID=487 RepID=UPI0015D638AA|nr:hypothetical protein [Neisseria meningitidis]
MPSEKSKKQDTERILLFCKRKMLILQLRQQELQRQVLQQRELQRLFHRRRLPEPKTTKQRQTGIFSF